MLTNATLTGPVTGGQRGWPFLLPLIDLAPVGYVAEEFFLDGTAAAYEAKPGTGLAVDGRWRVRQSRTAPFRTRVLKSKTDCLTLARQDRERSPYDSLHRLYRALIPAHRERVKQCQKCCLTRKYGHLSSLLIMVCSNLSVPGSNPGGGALPDAQVRI